jgi:hypothetical protein
LASVRGPSAREWAAVVVAGGAGEVAGPTAAPAGTSAVAVAVAAAQSAGWVVVEEAEDDVLGRAPEWAVAGSSGRAG